FGRGALNFLYPGNRKVLAYLRQWENESVLCIANLSRAPQPVELDLSAFRGRVPIELLGRSAFPPIGELPYFITLPGYGFYWLLLAEEAAAPSWHEDLAPPLPELLTLVAPQGWPSLMSGMPRKLLEERILLEYLRPRRWFGAKSQKVTGISISGLAEMPCEPSTAMIATVAVELDGEPAQSYALPLSVLWEEETDGQSPLVPFILGRVRRGAKTGLLCDDMTNDRFVRQLVSGIGRGHEITPAAGGSLHFAPTTVFPSDVDIQTLPVSRTAREQSNTSVRVGDGMILKLFR